MVTSRRSKPVIHLLSVAGSCKSMLPELGCAHARDLIALVQDAVGDRYRVTGSTPQIEAVEDQRRGGRRDDAARVREIERTFADQRIVAAVALRGGAWLTRILGHIDFDILKRRRRGLALFGFSELTSLINIAAQYEKVYAYHDLGPGYLLTGMADYARRNYSTLQTLPDGDPAAKEAFTKGWAAGRFLFEFESFFKDVVAIIEGRGSARKVTGQWIKVKPQVTTKIIVVGGNLTTTVTLMASRFAPAIQPQGRWLLIEDVRETPDRVDRLLAHLSLAGWLTQYRGVLLGRFNDAQEDHTPAVLECLKRHLRRTPLPIVMTKDVGHVWPMSPVPLGRPFCWHTRGTPQKGRAVSAIMPWHDWRVV